MNTDPTSTRLTRGLELSLLLVPLLLAPAGCGGQPGPPTPPARVFAPTPLFDCGVDGLAVQCGQRLELTPGFGQMEGRSVIPTGEARATQTFRVTVEGNPEAMAQMMQNFRAELEKTARAQNITIIESVEEEPGSKTRGFRMEYAFGGTRGRLHATLERGKRFDRDENSKPTVEPWGGWTALLTITQQESPE